jgi:hypothetical protein
VLYPSEEVSTCPEESLDELLLPPPLLVLGPNVKLLPPPLPPPSLPNTLSQQSSTSVFERLPDNPVTHLMNLLFEPELVLLLSPVVDESLLLLLESLESEPLFEANAKVAIPLLDAVIKDTAVTIAIIANDVVITFFLYIEITSLGKVIYYSK